MRKLALFLAIVLLCAFTASVSGLAAEVSTIDRLLAEGKIVVGCSLSGMPIGGYDESGNPCGYDVDWAHRLAEILGVEIEIVDVNGDTRIPALTSGQVDVIFANITGNLTRAQTIDFSIPYLRCGIKMLTQAGSPYANVEELNTPDAKVAVGRGTTGEDLVLLFAPDANITYVDVFTDQLLLLQQGRVDAVFEDSTLIDYAAGNSGGALAAPDRLYTSDPICIGARKGDIEWVRFLDMFVSWQISSGWQNDTYNKWWGVDSPAMQYLW
ncbi:MAG: transporter substrate-binding domain-containing protein [Clostridia bacterium]|nr:transporter substrate-binding domain-containing protein [Clostridia bacterium]